jgi:hypothetical protein
MIQSLTNGWLRRPCQLQYSFAIATYKNKIYCIGGYIIGRIPTSINEIYDTVTDTWKTGAPIPTPRAKVNAHFLNGKIYVVGGELSIANPTNVAEVYDPETDTWITNSPLPYATYSYASAAFGGKLYIFGGISTDNDLAVVEKMIQIYDSNSGSWSRGASAPYVTVYAFSGVTTGSKAPPRVYLIDGLMLDYPYSQMYDPATDNWTTGIAHPTRRMGFSVAVVDDLLYAIGGLKVSRSPFDPINPRDFVAQCAINEQYTPFGYGTVQPTQPPNTPTQSGGDTEKTPEPTLTQQFFPTTTIAAVSAVAVRAGVIVYLKKRHP